MLRFISILIISIKSLNAQIVLKDSLTHYPVSYAAVSFGNGNGIFADDDGKFFFTKNVMC